MLNTSGGRDPTDQQPEAARPRFASIANASTTPIPNRKKGLAIRSDRRAVGNESQQRSLIATWVRDATNADLLMDSALGEPAQSLGHGMVVDPEQPSDPGTRDGDASLTKLKSLRRHGERA